MTILRRWRAVLQASISIARLALQSVHPLAASIRSLKSHLPEAFMAFFARQLAAQTNRTVTVAEKGTEVRASHIYIAPGDAHLIVRNARNRVYIDHLDHYADSRYCPSVDAMFASIAGVYGQGTLAIVLSGMGNDGAHGARLLSQEKATIIVQDEDSSVVWGMPGAVAREGLASAILSPTSIAQLLAKVRVA
jgi:two-component system, chemotaxis family, protein-glutamate methylesterase/glutaminase